MQLIQIESLLMKADMLSLVVIMFIAVTRIEVFKSLRRLDISARYAKGHNKFLVFKVPYYATTSVSQKLLDFFAQLKHE